MIINILQTGTPLGFMKVSMFDIFGIQKSQLWTEPYQNKLLDNIN